VPYDEIFSGGPPRDGIPPIYSPKFESISQAGDGLKGVEPVVSFNLGGDARAYPLQILIWHEIVNDVVAGQPVMITFCPLCNTAIAFERTLEGKVYDFGTSGLLRFSDLVMRDHQTESLWQQATGEAIVGDLTGKRLTFIPATVVSWTDFKAAFPQGKVFSKDTGFSRSYGRNPYSGYDNSERPFLFSGEVDERLGGLERVVPVTAGEADVAYPFSVISRLMVVHDRVGDREVVVFH